jgi:uncharacterized protein YjbI with pentapeptide repeats
MKIAFALVLSAALMASLACDDLGQLKQSGFNECVECDLSGANLTGANLSHADLRYANLTGADLTLVVGADLIGALNVPDKYVKD